MFSIFIIYGLFSYFVPLVFDDVSYRNMYVSYNDGSGDFSLSTLLYFAKEIWLNDNGRFSNIFSPVFSLMLPRAVFPLLTGGTVAIMFYLMTVLSEVNNNRKASVIIFVWALSLVVLPWRNNIMVHVFLLNYVYSTVLILLFLLIILKSERERLPWWLFILGLFISFIAGGFHEGFSVPICMSLFAICIKNKFKLSFQWWIMAGIFGLVTLYLIFSPGTLLRASRELNGHSTLEKIKIAFTQLPLVVLLIVTTLVFLTRNLRKKFKLLAKDSAFIMLFIATLTSAFVTLSVNSAPRASWPAELFALTTLLFFLKFISFGKKKYVFRYFSFVVLIALYLFFANVIRWQRKEFIEYNEISALFDKSSTGTVFYDIIDPDSFRIETLFLPIRSHWVSDFQYKAMRECNSHPEKLYAVVPQSLKNYKKGSGRRIAGNGKLSDYEGVLLLEPQYNGNGLFTDNVYYTFTTENGRVYPFTECFRLTFQDREGNQMIYVRPTHLRLEDKIIKADFVGLL